MAVCAKRYHGWWNDTLPLVGRSPAHSICIQSQHLGKLTWYLTLSFLRCSQYTYFWLTFLVLYTPLVGSGKGCKWQYWNNFIKLPVGACCQASESSLVTLRSVGTYDNKQWLIYSHMMGEFNNIPPLMPRSRSEFRNSWPPGRSTLSAEPQIPTPYRWENACVGVPELCHGARALPWMGADACHSHLNVCFHHRSVLNINMQTWFLGL
jgi:hypothetical protein